MYDVYVRNRSIIPGPVVFVNGSDKMDSMAKKKVIVAMSGGVDSSVTASLCVQAGFDVTGVYMKNWSQRTGRISNDCPWLEDRRDAIRVAAKLNIPFETWDFEKEYFDRVMENFFAEYQAGRTPNPDVLCNKEIKFDAFLKRALNAGADFIATGHYARRVENNGEYGLLRGIDPNKDQSYFLYTVTQEALKHTIFPVGEYTKPEVRQLAQQFGLSTSHKPDSQGLCFVGEIDLKTFLMQRVAQLRGPIVTTHGKQLGEHDGISFYTIGQRTGLKIAADRPYYVAALQPKTNTVVVSQDLEDLLRTEMTIENLHWIGKPPAANKIEVQIRYRQKPVAAALAAISTDQATITFDEPQRAVTPGQSAVLYTGDQVLGGGIIQ